MKTLKAGVHRVVHVSGWYAKCDECGKSTAFYGYREKARAQSWMAPHRAGKHEANYSSEMTSDSGG